jgi:YidC/Oxa1 family membrane protein insertase
LPNSAALIAQVTALDMNFLGLDMSVVPWLVWPFALYPLLSGLSALALCAFQNRYNVLQLNQGFWGKWGTAIFLVAFSFYFALVLPCGVGLYWIAGNILSMAVLMLCNLIYDPRKYIDYSKFAAKPKLTPVQRREQRQLNSRKRQREKADARRFSQAKDKELVFYSEANGFYKYFAQYIDWLLEHSDITMHYVTSDINDQVLTSDNPRLQSYYIGPTALISFMMKLDADVVVMSMPDLDTFHIKRSLVRSDTEYIYLDHGMGSFTLVLREHALDNFDTIFAYGPNHVAEIRRLEEYYHLPEKQLVETGFGLIDSMIAKVAELPEQVNQPPIALIAPSWQKDNLIELCFELCVQPLLAAGFKVIVRPHPEYVKLFQGPLTALIQRHAEAVDAGQLVFQTDFSSSSTVYTADVLVTDWSTIAQEYCFSTKRPAIFINTPMKVMNPRWQEYGLEPLEISQRNTLGVSVEVSELAGIGELALQLVQDREQYHERITAEFERTFYNIGHSAAPGGRYLRDTVHKYRNYRRALADYQQAVLEASRA